jgi:hypothetical protein
VGPPCTSHSLLSLPLSLCLRVCGG